MQRAQRARKKAYHHGDLRRALLDATLALAAESGAAGVTLREAARRAGVSPTATYRHFADRQAMLATASEEGFQLLLRETEKCVASAGTDPRAQASSLCETYVRFALEHTAYFRLMYGQGSPPKAASPGLQAAARAVFQIFFHALARCLPDPADEATAKDIYFRVWALAHGVATLALEKQILFDIPARALRLAIRRAITDLLTASLPAKQAASGS